MKILIVEDNEADYLSIFHSLHPFQLDVYPGCLEDFGDFSDKLVRFAKTKNEIVLEIITKKISEYSPTHILLDLNLDLTGSSSDKSGLAIKEFMDHHHPLVKQFIISGYAEDKSIKGIEGWLSKNGTVSLEGQIHEKIIQKHVPFTNVPVTGPGTVEPVVIEPTGNTDGVEPVVIEPTGDTGAVEPVVIEPTGNTGKDSMGEQKQIPQINAAFFKIYERPKKLKSWGIYEHYKVLPWTAFIVDKIITYSFYLVLIFLFVAAPAYIGIKAYKDFDLIHIAEYSFIAFLPFLIVCGFFIFYKKSLRPYFLEEVVDPSTEDFESAGNLMKLTKKLFVSSLLSYLVIKLIELLCFEKPKMDKTIFQDFFNTENQFIQVYMLGGLIVALIVYYIFIDRHNTT